MDGTVRYGTVRYYCLGIVVGSGRTAVIKYTKVELVAACMSVAWMDE